MQKSTYDIDPKSKLLIEVPQHKYDLVIEVADNTDTVQTFDTPLENFDSEYVLLTSKNNQASFSICIRSNDTKDETTFKIKSYRIGVTTNELITQYSAASENWGKGNIAEAIYHWEEVIRLTAPLEFRHFLDLSLLNLATIKYQENQYTDAIKYLNQIINSLESNPTYQYKANWLMARILTAQKKPLEAIKLLEGTIVGMPKSSSTRFNLAKIYSDLAEAHIESYQISKAEHYLNLALDIEELGSRQLATIYDNYGYFFITQAIRSREPKRSQLFKQALDFEFKSKREYEKIQDTRKVAGVDNNIGTIYDRIGEVRLAYNHYYSALKLIENTTGNNRRKAFFNKNVGMLLQYLGAYKDALEFQKTSRTLFAKSQPFWAHTVDCQIGATLRELNRIERAIEKHQSCLNYFKNFVSISIEQDNAEGHIGYEELANAQFQMAKNFQSLNEFGQANALIQQAQNTLANLEQLKMKQVKRDADYQSADNHGKSGIPPIMGWTVADLKANLLLLSAEVHLNDHELEAANWLAKEAISLAKKARYPSAEIDAYVLATDSAFRSNKIEDANYYADAGIALAEKMQTHLDPYQYGPSWSGKTHKLYELKLALILSTPHSSESHEKHHEIFGISEAARSKSFRYVIDKSIQLEQREINERLNKLSVLADTRANGMALQKNSLGPSLSHQKFLLNILSSEQAEIEQAAKLSDLKLYLKEEQVLLYYVFVQGNLYSLLIDKDESHWSKLATKNDVEAAIIKASDVLKDNSRAFKKVLLDLSKILLPKTALLKRYKELFIVPHKSLFGIPFSALSLRLEENRYQPLIRHASVRIIPSVSKFIDSKGKRDKVVPYSSDLALFYNPYFGSLNGKNRATAWTSSISPLVYSQLEGEKILRSFGSKDVDLFANTDATKKSLFNESTRKARILHISTHGYYKPDDPQNVGFALSGESEESGFVSITEILKNEYQNQLVVLSGCETNQGELLAGEGKQSLARGFLLKGAHNTLSTLWPVADNSSSKFMDKFYSYLVENRSISEALRLSQLDMFNQFRHRHPYYWAAYTLQSNHLNEVPFN